MLSGHTRHCSQTPPPTTSIEHPCNDELFSLVDPETNTVTHRIAPSSPCTISSDDYPCDDELFSLVDPETNTVIHRTTPSSPCTISSADYPCDEELFSLVDPKTNTVIPENNRIAPSSPCTISSDDYPCDDELFSLVDPETNTVIAENNRSFSMPLIPRTPIVGVNAAASQRLAGISRLLSSLEHPTTLPYSLTSLPRMVFFLHVPPDNFSVPPNLLRRKTNHLQHLCENSIFTAFGVHPCTGAEPVHHFFVQTLLPPSSRLKIDGRFDHHETAEYRNSWPHHSSYSLFATGLAEILNMDHQRDIWILLADRGCGFASWQAWAEQMKKCTPNSMFGVALRSFFFASSRAKAYHTNC